MLTALRHLFDTLVPAQAGGLYVEAEVVLMRVTDAAAKIGNKVFSKG